MVYRDSKAMIKRPISSQNKQPNARITTASSSLAISACSMASLRVRGRGQYLVAGTAINKSKKIKIPVIKKGSQATSQRRGPNGAIQVPPTQTTSRRMMNQAIRPPQVSSR
jgi:hypothetical protein